MVLQACETFRWRTINLLKAKAREERKCKFSKTDIAKDPNLPSIMMIEAEFVTVENALRAANLYPYWPNRDDLIRSMRNFYHQYHRSPKQRDAETGLLPYRAKLYAKEFVKWNYALVAAGLDIYSASSDDLFLREYMVNRIIIAIQETFGRSGILPPMREYDAIVTRYKSETCRSYIGDWQEVANATGLKLSESTMLFSNFNSSIRSEAAS